MIMAHERDRKLPDSFSPGPNTVICGRGKICAESRGNRQLKGLITRFLPQYSEARNKMEKSSIVSSIINMVKNKSYPDVAFVKYEKGIWYQVDDGAAREKVGGIIRDCLHDQYRSSSKAKLARRKAGKHDEVSTGSHGTGSMPSTTTRDVSLDWGPSFETEMFRNNEQIRLNAMSRLVGKDEMVFPNNTSNNNGEGRHGTTMDISLPLVSTFLHDSLQNPGLPPLPNTAQSAAFDSFGPLDQPILNPAMLQGNLRSVSESNVGMNQESVDDLPDDLSGIFDD